MARVSLVTFSDLFIESVQSAFLCGWNTAVYWEVYNSRQKKANRSKLNCFFTKSLASPSAFHCHVLICYLIPMSTIKNIFIFNSCPFKYYNFACIFGFSSPVFPLKSWIRPSPVSLLSVFFSVAHMNIEDSPLEDATSVVNGYGN